LLRNLSHRIPLRWLFVGFQVDVFLVVPKHL
jgi:hypothetical protein